MIEIISILIVLTLMNTFTSYTYSKISDIFGVVMDVLVNLLTWGSYLFVPSKYQTLLTIIVSLTFFYIAIINLAVFIIHLIVKGDNNNNLIHELLSISMHMKRYMGSNLLDSHIKKHCKRKYKITLEALETNSGISSSVKSLMQQLNKINGEVNSDKKCISIIISGKKICIDKYDQILSYSTNVYCKISPKNERFTKMLKRNNIAIISMKPSCSIYKRDWIHEFSLQIGVKIKHIYKVKKYDRKFIKNKLEKYPNVVQIINNSYK